MVSADSDVATRHPLACRSDVARLAVLVAGGAAAMVAPGRWDPAISNILFRLLVRTAPHKIDRVAEHMSAALPASMLQDPRAAAEEHYRMRLEDGWGRVRGMRRHGWQPRIEMEGLERVREGLSRNRGVVLWSMRFSSATAIKQGFHRGGVPLVHLSSRNHGAPCISELGVRVVAPMYCRAENHYLAERVQIPNDGSLAYLIRLREHLRSNAVVSVFGEHHGRQNQEVSVLGKHRQFARGAPSLAWLEGSALFTVCAVRMGPFHYKVIVGDEIEVNTGMPRREFADEAVTEYARRLEGLIKDHPADWHGWSSDDPDR